MSALTVTGVLSLSIGGVGAQKRMIFSATGPASYDTGGSLIDLSSANATLTGLDAQAAFTKVNGLALVGVNPHGSGKYLPQYVRASAGAPATGKVKAYDVTTDPGAEVSSTTDLSATTFFFEAIGT